MDCSARVRSPTRVRTCDASVRAPGLVVVHVHDRPGSHFVTSQTTVGSHGWRMRALAPRRMGPSTSSTDVNDDAHVGHRSTSVKTNQTTSIGASMVIDARSALAFRIVCLLPFSFGRCVVAHYFRYSSAMSSRYFVRILTRSLDGKLAATRPAVRFESSFRNSPTIGS